MSLWRLKTLAMAAFCWMAMFTPLFAAESSSKKGGGTWVMSYGLVILCIGLGMMFVCRSARRRDRPKVEGYDDSKTKIQR